MIGFISAEEMMESAEKCAPYRNFIGTIINYNEERATVVTDLFDKATLKAYAKKNCNIKPTKEEAKLFSDYKGGGQGDYSTIMDLKINHVVEALTEFPKSKRAVIMTNNNRWNHRDTDQAKCCRELHFYLEPTTKRDIPGRYGYKLSCTGIFRAQAVDIMPKNFYFTYYVMDLIKKKLQKSLEPHIELGNYTHFVTTLVPTRND